MEAYIRKGKVLSELKRYDEAIKCYDEGINLSPNSKEALFEKGNALNNVGRHEEAVDYFNQAIKVDP
jgi:tetratricopeptide (TPR) repeat protein